MQTPPSTVHDAKVEHAAGANRVAEHRSRLVAAWLFWSRETAWPACGGASLDWQGVSRHPLCLQFCMNHVPRATSIATESLL